jgi:gas vesicle protein
MDTSAVINFKDATSCSADLASQELIQLLEAAAAAKQHLEEWEKTIDAKLIQTEQVLDKQLMQIQMVISQFNRTLQSNSQQEWQHAATAVHSASKHQTILLQETCNELKNTTKEIHIKVERTAHQITKNLNTAMQGLHAGELQQLVEDSAAEVKNFSAAATTKMNGIVKWFHWKNLGLVFLLSLIVTLLVSLYIDDEWPWEEHNVVLKQRTAGQAVLSAWPQLTQLDRQQIMDDWVA